MLYHVTMEKDFITLSNQVNIIEDVKLHKLVIHRDERGMLMETIKIGWEGILDETMPFGQTYYSITNPGFARDESDWHCHPTKQTDRFVILKGDVVIALYDWRKESKTYGKLNLFLMGDHSGDDNQYLLLIPKNVLHATCNVGKEPARYLGNPTHVYDPSEEGRIPFSQVPVAFSDGTPFSWDAVRKHFA